MRIIFIGQASFEKDFFATLLDQDENLNMYVTLRAQYLHRVLQR